MTEGELLEAIDACEEALAAMRPEGAETRELLEGTRKRLDALYAELLRRDPDSYRLVADG